MNRYLFGLLLVLAMATVLLIGQNPKPSATHGFSIDSTLRTLQSYHISLEFIEPENLPEEALSRTVPSVVQPHSPPSVTPRENETHRKHVLPTIKFLISIVIIAIALTWIIFIQSEKINNKQNKASFKIICFSVLLIITVLLLFSSFERIGEQPNEAIPYKEILLLLFNFMLQELEGFPEPFNQPRNVLRIFAYIVLFAITAWIFASAFVNLLTSIAARYFERLGNSKSRGSKKPEIEEYYRINLGQTIISFWLSFFMIFLGFIIIAFIILAAIFGEGIEIEVTIIAGVSAIFLEFIGGTSLLLYGKNIQYFGSFFRALVRDHDIDKAKNITDKMKEGAERQQILADIINSLAYRPESLNPDVQKNNESSKDKSD